MIYSTTFLDSDWSITSAYRRYRGRNVIIDCNVNVGVVNRQNSDSLNNCEAFILPVLADFESIG